MERPLSRKPAWSAIACKRDACTRGCSRLFWQHSLRGKKRGRRAADRLDASCLHMQDKRLEPLRSTLGILAASLSPRQEGHVAGSYRNSALVVFDESSVATAAMSSLMSASACVMYGQVPPLDRADDWKRQARPEHDEVVK